MLQSMRVAKSQTQLSNRPKVVKRSWEKCKPSLPWNWISALSNRMGYSLLEFSRHAGSFSNLNPKDPEETLSGWEVLCADLGDRFCVSFLCSLAVLWLVPY